MKKKVYNIIDCKSRKERRLEKLKPLKTKRASDYIPLSTWHNWNKRKSLWIGDKMLVIDSGILENLVKALKDFQKENKQK